MKRTKAQLIEENRKLRKRNEFLENLIMFICHDAKNMIINIVAYARFLLKMYKDPHGPKASRIRSIETIGAFLEQLFENLFGLMMTDKPELRVEEFSFGEIVETLKAMFHLKLGTEVQLSVNKSALNVKLTANKSELLRLFYNLFENAFKYGGEVMTEIRVSHRLTSEYHVFSINNNGVSVKKQDCERIFGLFEREEGISPEIIGYGIGLAEVKEICMRHGGYACCETGDKRGVKFDIYISRSL